MPLKIKKPEAIVMDLTGVVTTKGFMTDSPEAKNNIKEHIRHYLNECWRKRTVILDITLIRKNQEKTRTEQNVPLPPDIITDRRKTRADQMESVINNIIWRIDNEAHDPDPGILASFHLHFNEWATRKGILKIPVYEEVSRVLREWKDQGIKLYVALGSEDFFRMVLSSTSQGDLTPLIDSHLNLMTYDGKTAYKNFSKLPVLVNEPAANILYLTRLPGDARLAKSRKIPCVIVVRDDFQKKGGLKSSLGSNLSAASSKTDLTKGQTETAAEHVARMTTHLDVNTQELSSNVATMTMSREELNLSSASQLSLQDLKNFPVIHRLDEIMFAPHHAPASSVISSVAQ